MPAGMPDYFVVHVWPNRSNPGGPVLTSDRFPADADGQQRAEQHAADLRRDYASPQYLVVVTPGTQPPDHTSS
jgi:hypothetical protein